MQVENVFSILGTKAGVSSGLTVKQKFKDCKTVNCDESGTSTLQCYWSDLRGLERIPYFNIWNNPSE